MTNPSYHEIKASDEFIYTLTKCLTDAVGDDIKEDVKLNRLITHNSSPSRIWDLLNRNICESFSKSDVIANPTKRGGWEMVPVFDRSSGIIYSTMREERFVLLKKELPKRRSAHYIDAFVRSLNKDLTAPVNQISLFPILPHQFNNESHIQDIVQKIIADLGIPNEVIKRHALLLFRSFNNELSSLRCCIVDSKLDIVAQDDWSNYIKASDGAIVEKVENKTSTYVDPKAGLKYKQKAKDKLGQKRLSDNKSDEMDITESDD